MWNIILFLLAIVLIRMIRSFRVASAPESPEELAIALVFALFINAVTIASFPFMLMFFSELIFSYSLTYWQALMVLLALSAFTARPTVKIN